MELKKHKEDLGEIQIQLSELEAKGLAQEDGFTDEQFSLHEELTAKEKTLERKIATLSRCNKPTIEKAEVRSVTFGEHRQPDKNALNKAVHGWLMEQGEGILQFGKGYNEECVELAHRYGYRRDTISFDQTSNVASEGGNLHSEALLTGVTRALKAYGGLYNYATVEPRPNGNEYFKYTNDNTNNVGVWKNQNQVIANASQTFGKVTFKLYKCTNGCYMISRESIIDSEVDILSEITNNVSEAISRKVAHATLFGTGDGDLMPEGLLENVATVNADADDVVSTEDLKRLKLSVNEAYWNECAFYMSASTWYNQIWNLTDLTGRPMAFNNINNPGIVPLLDSPVYLIPEMPAASNGNISVVYGRMKDYVIPQQGGLFLTVLRERFAEYDALGVVAALRVGGKLQRTDTLKGLLH